LTNVLLMLIALLSLGASAQSAACEAACAVSAAQPSCHKALFQRQGAVEGDEHATANSHDDCSHTMLAGTIQTRPHNFGRDLGSACKHYADSAIENRMSADQHAISTHWTVFNVVTMPTRLTCRDAMARKAPPFRTARAEILTVVLRV
jgi:hypothetical protein